MSLVGDDDRPGDAENRSEAVSSLLGAVLQILVKHRHVREANKISELQALYASDRDAFNAEIADGWYWVVSFDRLLDVGFGPESRRDAKAFFSSLLELHHMLSAAGVVLPSPEDVELMLRAYSPRR